MDYLLVPMLMDPFTAFPSVEKCCQNLAFDVFAERMRSCCGVLGRPSLQMWSSVAQVWHAVKWPNYNAVSKLYSLLQANL